MIDSYLGWRRRRSERARHWRLKSAELRLADAEHDLRKWGFGYTPSERYRRERKILRLQEEVEAARADLGEDAE